MSCFRNNQGSENAVCLANRSAGESYSSNASSNRGTWIEPSKEDKAESDEEEEIGAVEGQRVQEVKAKLASAIK